MVEGMPSVAVSTSWFVRVTKSHQECMELIRTFVLLRAVVRLLCIGHVGDKTEKEHIHFVVQMPKECQKQSLDVAVKKHFGVSGSDYSSKVWDGADGACSYMFHDSDYKLIYNKGFTDEDIERFKDLHKKVQAVVDINKERGAKRVVERVVQFFVDRGVKPTRGVIATKFMVMIREGEMYEPGDYQLKKYVEEVFDKTVFGAPDTVNQIYSIYSMSLNAYSRASAVAANYQQYRLKLLEFQFKPFKDTFVAGSAAGGSVPYLHYIVDRNESVPVDELDFQGMREMGAKPIRFDDRTIKIKYRPGVSYSVNDDGGQVQWQAARISPWLNTNGNSGSPTAPWIASSVDHKGLLYGVEQLQTSGTEELNYEVEITAHWEFRNPLVQRPQSGVTKAVVRKEIA